MENQVSIEDAVKENDEDRKSSDESDIVFVKTVSTAVKSQVKDVPAVEKSQIPTNDEIECICLDDSDSDNIEVSFSPEPSKSNSSFPTVEKETSKKIDYLNLESSDTDDEQERIQDDVNNLLSSAAILNDLECGPTKPVPDMDLSITLPSCTDDAALDIKRPSSPASNISVHDEYENTMSPAIDNSEDEICFLEHISNKKIKSEPHTTDDISEEGMCSQGKLSNIKTISDSRIPNVNLSTIEVSDSRIKMYRKDDRIVAAYKKKGSSSIPSTLNRMITAHEKSISSLSWCAVPYSHLFLSSSLDCTVKVWDIYSENKPIQVLNVPLGVRAAEWSKNGEQIVAGGFGNQLYVIDVLSGKTHMIYKAYSHVSCIAIHPGIEDVILCGTQSAILGFDLRVDSVLPVRTFMPKSGEVLDIAFLNKKEFVCSTSVVSRDSANRTIMVWDFNSGAIMSNQIFLERYTCPSLKLSPFGSSFIAQTNGDYIATFSSQRPYKIKDKRYTGHMVAGYGIECCISPDGQYVASGDAKGKVYFYNYGDTSLVDKLTIKPDVATTRLQWHPILSNTMVVSTWDGEVHVYK